MDFPGKPTLMIVDDEQNFTESLQLAIEDEFTISVVGSLESARQILKRFQPAAVLLDLRLPDGDGLDLLHDLNMLTKLPVVVVMTAHMSVESIERAMSEGVVDYCTKPLNIEKLKLELKKNIQRKAEQK
ncbi:MAG TPA: response regulator [Nitrospirota bacterium]|nr:response regulator [Nitrospirota bacterium]